MTRPIPAALTALLLLAACAPLVVDGIDFGTNSSRFANDGECDDPRFTGAGMADQLRSSNIKSDSTDCATLYQAEQIRPARSRAQWDRAQCRRIEYGDDSSPYARDGDCDDPRFTGPGTFSLMLASDRGKDATDCRALCNSGAVWLK
ncbi:hypothetical protein AADZ90_005815 [Aestuariibius sp. 2305UL40-4]|uniref:hypothetical protein n=1 Tax=Aestuariibius violaceus TaxID=3234132 RepID=UPI00345ECC99